MLNSESQGDVAITAKGKNRCFAVAVRDELDLFLFLTICRSPSGDVYVNFPRDQEANWKPHTSYHASGQHHHKSYGHKARVRRGPQPDSTFSDSTNVVTTGITAQEPRALNAVVHAAAFEDVFEIPASDLKMKCGAISVDLTDPNGKPIITLGSTIVRQAIFKDAIPWIVVTLFDAGTPTV